jgi:HlyD family secretion protein
MPTKVLPGTHSGTPLHTPGHGVPRLDSAPRAYEKPLASRWRQRVLLAIGGVAVVAALAVLIRGFTPSPDLGPKLTHSIMRGDLRVTAIEPGTLESSDNKEIKCKVRGRNTVIWVVESGTHVEAGDELVRLDTLFMEEQIDERTKYALWSKSGADWSVANVARAKLAIPEYEEGRYVSELIRLETDLAIAEAGLLASKNMLSHAELMTESGYVSELEVEEKEFAVARSELQVEVKKTEIDVLKRYTKAVELETLRGNLAAGTATHEANAERALADASRRDRAVEELKHCVIRAERSGLVIYPSAALWEASPDIAEGATVYKEQVLLLMPDLSKMQVKVGVHESVVESIKPGQTARVTLPNKIVEGEVTSVASVAKPASWWNGNVVEYDTIIRLPSMEGLAPGMSAEVEILMAQHVDVVMIPVAAVVETKRGNVCWVKTALEVKRCLLELGDSNGVFTVVKAGLKEGDEVVLNPSALEQTQSEAPLDRAEGDQPLDEVTDSRGGTGL